ncbi:MAG: carboxypeptidase regulatory-like domain-containing protein [Bryobacteraceae bacterium]
MAILLLAVAPAPAQSIYGSLSGKVLDPSGAVIPKATVSIKNMETGLVRNVETDGTGFYRAASLNVGKYQVEYSAAGFEKLVRGPIVVDAAVDRSVEVTLKPGATQEVVTVIEQAPLIESTQAQISKGVETYRILELPGLNTLNGLALLQPGAVNNQNSRPGSGFAVNGGRTRSNNFTIDGANNNDQSLSIPRQNLPPEHIAQFRMITNNFSAEYGRNSGSFINQITKSGSNDFHGIARWTWQGNGLDSLSTAQERSYNSWRSRGAADKEALRKSRQVEVDNLGLVSVGGPIKKDHSFFYIGYDREWYRTSAVPTQIGISPQGADALRANANLWAPGTLDYLLKTFLVANDPTSRGNINVSAGGKVIPVPLQQINRAIGGALPYGTSYWRWMAKTDHKITDRDNVSVRYLIDDYLNPGSPTAIPGNEIGTAYRNQSATVNDVHVFGATTVNETRATFARRAFHYPENLPPYLEIGGFTYVGNYNYPQFRVDNLWEFTDSLSFIRGRHSFRAGGNLLRYQLNSFFAPNYNGYIRYPSLTDFLLDTNAMYQRYAGEGMLPARTTELGVYFQDDFRALPSLTLNMGIRYEYTGAPFGYFSENKPDINNFGPRFGFAWNPRASGGLLGTLLGGGKTSVRGGYSLAYDQVFQNILLNVARNYPRGVTITESPVSGRRMWDPAARPPAPKPDAYVAQGNDPKMLPQRLFMPNTRITQPYGQQYSLGIERQFLENWAFKVFYVGTRGIKLVREVETNVGFNITALNASPATYQSILPSLLPIKNAAGAITGYRRDPTRASVLVAGGLAQSTYHSLQVTLEKRFSKNLQFEVNYTYSSFINDSDDILGGQTNSTLPSVPFNFRLDRGRSGLDQPHRLVANYVYEFPNPFRNRVLTRVLGGWEISGITTVASGTPFTILNSDNALGILPGAVSTVELSQRAIVNLNGTRPMPTSAGVASPYFVHNPSNTGIIGTAGRNTERTGGLTNFNAALVKNIRTFSEAQKLQIRWEVTNALMHRNFTVIPTNTVTRDTDTFRFLNLGQTTVSGRTMIFGLRYLF